MKKMFMALAVVAVASLASAVTVKWSSSEISGDGGVSGWFGVAVIAGHIDGSVGLTTILSYNSSSNTDANYTAKDGYTLLDKTKIVGDSAYAELSNSEKASFSATNTIAKDAIADGKFALVLFNEYNVAYYVQNVTITAWSRLEDTATVNLGDLGAMGWTKSDTTLVAPTTVQVLPEPTVMALLALGVAGIALRRKLA